MLYVFPNCKSLWIKASAKWLNVNVITLAFPCLQLENCFVILLRKEAIIIKNMCMIKECNSKPFFSFLMFTVAEWQMTEI